METCPTNDHSLPAGQFANLMHTQSTRDSVAFGLHRDPEEQFSLSPGF